MENRVLKEQDLQEFHDFLILEEKSAATLDKYLRDSWTFYGFAGDQPVTKELVMAYKEELMNQHYAVRSINSMLASINMLFHFLGWNECKVKSLKTQRQIYCPEDKELTKAEYMRLLRAAEGRPQLWHVMETICSTGIRVSELKYFTVEAVERGEIEINNKGKIRKILVPARLKKRLLAYARERYICEGMIFTTRTGTPLNRSNIWSQMKSLCEAARVEAGKVFPHNLRKLFARTFYSIAKDLAKLADVLGHSNINTTRIYIMATGTEHRRQLDRMGLVV